MIYAYNGNPHGCNAGLFLGYTLEPAIARAPTVMERVWPPSSFPGPKASAWRTRRWPVEATHYARSVPQDHLDEWREAAQAECVAMPRAW